MKKEELKKLREKLWTFEEAGDSPTDEWIEVANGKYEAYRRRNRLLYQIPSNHVGFNEDDPSIFTLHNIRGILARFRVKKENDEVVWG
jgi:hypothetical protein